MKKKMGKLIEGNFGSYKGPERRKTPGTISDRGALSSSAQAAADISNVIGATNAKLVNSAIGVTGPDDTPIPFSVVIGEPRKVTEPNRKNYIDRGCNQYAMVDEEFAADIVAIKDTLHDLELNDVVETTAQRLYRVKEFYNDMDLNDPEDAEILFTAVSKHFLALWPSRYPRHIDRDMKRFVTYLMNDKLTLETIRSIVKEFIRN